MGNIIGTPIGNSSSQDFDTDHDSDVSHESDREPNDKSENSRPEFLFLSLQPGKMKKIIVGNKNEMADFVKACLKLLLEESAIRNLKFGEDGSEDYFSESFRKEIEDDLLSAEVIKRLDRWVVDGFDDNDFPFDAFSHWDETDLELICLRVVTNYSFIDLTQHPANVAQSFA